MTNETEKRPAKEDPVNRSNESEEKLALILRRMVLNFNSTNATSEQRQNGSKHKTWRKNSHSGEERDQTPFNWNKHGNNGNYCSTYTYEKRYQAPQNNIEEADIDGVFNSQQSTILAGDLNSKHPQYNSNTLNRKGKQLKKIADERKLTVDGPTEDTHIHTSTGSTDVLDLVILKNVTTSYYLETINDLSADHLPVIITVSIESSNIQQTIHATN
ncbi:hypothetical protein Trydic_g7615 [Trypoxylus dichotomus]